MKTTDRFISAFDSILLVLVMGWSVTVIGALVSPQAQVRNSAGTVEVYSLVNAEWLATGNVSQRPAA